MGMDSKRLFLLAGYDKFGVVDDALRLYVRALNKCGDVVCVMDSDCAPAELQKLEGLTVYAAAERHEEYDFGSYKRAYVWACENLNLDDYDFVYLVNDSVFGPLYDLMPYLKKMEDRKWDAFGIVKNPHPNHPHIQSWFVGMKKSVAMTSWFDAFMRGIVKLKTKGEITSRYEQGLTRLFVDNGMTWGCLYVERGRGVYNHVKKLYRAKMPFMKKVALNRHRGALGAQIEYVLRRVEPGMRDAIFESGARIYGDGYMKWLMTRNPIKICWRRVRYAIYKLFVEGV